MIRTIQLFIFCFCSIISISQPLNNRPSSLGIHYSIYDFARVHPFQFSQVDQGLSISYIKGINRYFDWQLNLSGAFPDSTAKKNLSTEKTLLLQTDIAIRTRFRESKKNFQPYLLTGTGLSYHQKNWGSYLLAGVGIELHYKELYFPVTASYHLSLSQHLNHHFYYSIGIAGIVGMARKPKKTAAIPIAVTQKINTDRDGDGIADSLDLCPLIPGLTRFQGCPDSDGDGIADKEDQCPQVFGFAKYAGCPVPDTDKDGINDDEDQCPSLPGTLRYKGCPVPDSDKDGLNDEEDSCVYIAGLKENKGCPPLSKEITGHIELAAKKIFFTTGSYELLPKSFPALKEVAEILRQNPLLHLIIEGHTDNVADAKSNQLLSENRAHAVRDYLLRQNIEPSRISASGYGMEKPVASNSTSAGRAKNRRVELKIQ